MRIGWGITGAGHLLLETFEVMERLAGEHSISCFISSAGERVVKIYGLWGRLVKICPGGYYREVITEDAFHLAGRFLRRGYKALVVSPASSNTIAKIVSGIADTLVTSAVAQAEKGGVPVVIVPTDQEGGGRTKLPYLIDRERCRGCKCIVAELCPARAIVFTEGLPRIDLGRCEGCGICLEQCPRGAISFGREVEFTPREVDLANLRKLRGSGRYLVLARPEQIPSALEGLEHG